MVKSADCASRGPEFNFQKPRRGSKPPVMTFGAFFWPSGTHEGRTLYT